MHYARVNNYGDVKTTFYREKYAVRDKKRCLNVKNRHPLSLSSGEEAVEAVGARICHRLFDRFFIPSRQQYAQPAPDT